MFVKALCKVMKTANTKCKINIVSRYLLFFIFISVSTCFAQSAWTKKKGESYIQLSFNTINNYNEIYGDPEYKTERKITDKTLQIYGEYGVSDKTTLIVNLPIKFISVGNLTKGFSASTISDSKTSIGNIEIGIKHRFYNSKWVISGQINIEANTSSFYEDSGIRTGYDAWTFTPTLNASRAYNNFYTQSFIGLGLRSNDYSSNFKIGGEIGAKILSRIWIIGFVDVVKSFNNGDIQLPVSNTFTALYVNNQEYGGFGLKFIVELSNTFGVTSGFGGAFFGNNVAKQAAINVGLYYKI